MKSLREQLFTGNDMVCPAPAQIRDILAEDSISDALKSLLSFGASIRARGLTVFYDGRTYPSESLMHPGLSAAQGDALLIHFDGVHLGAESISQVRRNCFYSIVFVYHQFCH